MSTEKLTDLEQEYLSCDEPLLSGTKAVLMVITGVFASLGQALISPSSGYDKADRGLMKTVRRIRYTKYKKAVLNKQSGKTSKRDEKLLQKLNQKEFVLAQDAYDPDKFTQQIYEEYMKNHNEK